jgi:hypothetical protein
LVANLDDGYVRRVTSDHRIYAFLLSVSNRSDNNNSLAVVELWLTYKTRGAPITLKVRSDSTLETIADRRKALTLPARIDSHQMVMGWCYFAILSEVVADPNSVQSYKIVCRDSHGLEVSVEPIIVREDERETVSS